MGGSKGMGLDGGNQGVGPDRGWQSRQEQGLGGHRRFGQVGAGLDRGQGGGVKQGQRVSQMGAGARR